MRPVFVHVEVWETKWELLCGGCPAGGADLEAAGEELQSCVELSVVVQTLQGCQTLQTYLALLQYRIGKESFTQNWNKQR